MKNPGWANNRGSPPYISRNSSYQILPFPNAPAAMTFRAKATCGDEDGSISSLGLRSDFYVLKYVRTQEHTTKVPNLNPTWWLNYVFFTDQERGGKRGLLFHRWGGLGNHRYGMGFSGDTISVWDSLAFQPHFTAIAANVGFAFWSHDIGGHMPGGIEPELYLRWIQWGIFSPILRTHTTKNPGAERRIWAYPEPYADLMRQCFLRRYALQPYIYTEARKTYDTGLAFLHPLYFEWPEAPQA